MSVLHSLSSPLSACHISLASPSSPALPIRLDSVISPSRIECGEKARPGWDEHAAAISSFSSRYCTALYCTVPVVLLSSLAFPHFSTPFLQLTCHPWATGATITLGGSCNGSSRMLIGSGRIRLEKRGGWEVGEDLSTKHEHEPSPAFDGSAAWISSIPHSSRDGG
jgi:hypothetical protein